MSSARHAWHTPAGSVVLVRPGKQAGAAHRSSAVALDHYRAHRDREARDLCEATLERHPEDAEARGILNGDIVKLYNDRGGVLCCAVVTERVRPGVIHSYAFWFLIGATVLLWWSAQG